METSVSMDIGVLLRTTIDRLGEATSAHVALLAEAERASAARLRQIEEDTAPTPTDEPPAQAPIRPNNPDARLPGSSYAGGVFVFSPRGSPFFWDE